MRRTILLLAVAAMMAVMLVSAGPATADVWTSGGITFDFGETINESGTVTFTNIIDIHP